MLTEHQIPTLANSTFEGVRSWWDQIIALGLNTHPDDDPADIVLMETGTPAMTPEACKKVRTAYQMMFDSLGDAVYEIGANAYMSNLGYVMDHDDECYKKLRPDQI